MYTDGFLKTSLRLSDYFFTNMTRFDAQGNKFLAKLGYCGLKSTG